jgi:hypothetical protein
MVEKGPELARKQNNEWKLKSKRHKMGDDPQQLYIDEKKRKILSLQKQRKVDPGKVKEDQRKRQIKNRLINSQKKRLKKF